MKTLTELIDDIKTVQESVAKISQEMTELEASSQNKDADINISGIMQTASHYSIKEHCLAAINDDSVTEAYISLLMAIALCGVAPDVKTQPLLYPCRIAASFAQKPNVEIYFKKSLILDEEAIHNYVETIKCQGVRDAFILDALIMTITYDKGNLAKLELIGDVAALFDCDKSILTDLISVAKASVEHTSIDLESKKLQLTATQLFPYLQYCPQVVIISDKIVLICAGKRHLCENGVMMSKHLGCFRDVQEVMFHNITFNSDDDFYKQWWLYFENVDKVAFSNCAFVGFENGTFQMRNINHFLITDSEFNHCTRQGKGSISCPIAEYNKCDGDIDKLQTLPTQYGDFDELQVGIIGELTNVYNLDVVNCTFRCCAAILEDDSEFYGKKYLGCDIWYNRLFKATPHVHAKGCNYIQSCALAEGF